MSIRRSLLRSWPSETKLTTTTFNSFELKFEPNTTFEKCNCLRQFKDQNRLCQTWSIVLIITFLVTYKLRSLIVQVFYYNTAFYYVNNVKWQIYFRNNMIKLKLITLYNLGTTWRWLNISLSVYSNKSFYFL